MKDTFVLIGNFGSGKSELSLNFAMNSAASGKKTVLVDLDLINPYFRSSDMAKVLDDNGIMLHKPLFANTGVEAPSLPPDIYAVFIDEHETVIFDVGGDPAGAIALGQYKRNFDELPSLQTYYVINPNRPFATTPEAILEMMAAVSYTSRLTITGLINNANMSNETTVSDLMLGFETVRKVSEQSLIPVAYTAGEASVLDEFMTLARKLELNDLLIGQPLPIKRYMTRDWDRFIDSVG